MTFTYTPSAAPTDKDRIRFELGDTDSTAALWSDEEIAMVLALQGSVGKAEVSLILSAITRLAQEPDMSADWLKIDWRRSADQWKLMLSEKRREFGLGAKIDSGGQHSYRPDTLLKTPPDYGET